MANKYRQLIYNMLPLYKDTPTLDFHVMKLTYT